MTPLDRHLRRRIALEGPLTIAAYMVEALTNPDHGYYTTRDPLGEKGDFTTAPEVSQVFGELVGLWLADAWHRAGAPANAVLVELGPGRGTLMADALRAAQRMPGFSDAMAVHFVEASPRLRQAQKAAIAPRTATWHDSLATVPDGPTFLIANEFFDALPIHQLVLTDGGWRERIVVVTEEDRLAFAVSAGGSPLETLIPEHLKETAPDGAVFEVSPLSIAIARTISERVRGSGAALIVDYGHPVSAFGDTLQAVHRHQFSDVLATPGECDITAHVDFDAMSRTAAENGTSVFGPVTQGGLLAALGVEIRRRQLTAAADPDRKRAIETGIRRLISPQEMGTLFKALAILPPGSDPPAGFGDGA